MSDSSTPNQDYYTGETSKLIRQLCLASIAVIWLFRIPATNSLPEYLKMPLVLFIIALSFDFLQYFVGSILSQLKEVNKELPNSVIITLQIFFYTKSGFGLIAIIYMIYQLYSHSFFS